jgi:hypothetical protein
MPQKQLMASLSWSKTDRLGLKMGVKRLAAAVAALLVVSSAQARATVGEGIVFYSKSKPMTLRTAAQLKVGDKLVMQYPGSTGALICCIGATVTGKIGQAALVPIYSEDGIAEGNVSDMLRDAAVRGYRIKLRRHLYAHFGGSDEESTCSDEVCKLVGIER